MKATVLWGALGLACAVIVIWFAAILAVLSLLLEYLP